MVLHPSHPQSTDPVAYSVAAMQLYMQVHPYYTAAYEAYISGKMCRDSNRDIECLLSQFSMFLNFSRFERMVVQPTRRMFIHHGNPQEKEYIAGLGIPVFTKHLGSHPVSHTDATIEGLNKITDIFVALSAPRNMLLLSQMCLQPTEDKYSPSTIHDRFTRNKYKRLVSVTLRKIKVKMQTLRKYPEDESLVDIVGNIVFRVETLPQKGYSPSSIDVLSAMLRKLTYTLTLLGKIGIRTSKEQYVQILEKLRHTDTQLTKMCWFKNKQWRNTHG